MRASILALTATLATPAIAGADDAPITAKTAELKEVEAALEAAANRVRSSRRAVEAAADLERKTIEVLRTIEPESAKTFARYRELRGQVFEALAKDDRKALAELRPKIEPLIDRITQAQARAMRADPNLQLRAQVYMQTVDGIVRTDPDVKRLLRRMDRLDADLRDLRGELRRTPRGKAPALADARKDFRTAVFGSSDRAPAPAPPSGVLDRVRYDAPLGRNVAYVTPVKKGAKRPAIVWIAGGFDWGIGELFWHRASRANDPTAAAFREAGVVLMLPSLRGGNDNAGKNECLLGEVDDIIAAARFIAKRPDVDPERVYLGGHSTGGTLALLAAEQTTMFRAVFSFGPVSNPKDYGEICGTKILPDDEAYVRAPIEFIEHLRSPTWVIEGEDGNAVALHELAKYANGNVRFVLVPGLDHFAVLRPGSEVVARAILADDGEEVAIRIDGGAIAKK